MLTNERRIELYAEEALAYHKALVEGRQVRLEWGSRIRNPQGEYIAFIYRDDGLFLNKQILADG